MVVVEDVCGSGFDMHVRCDAGAEASVDQEIALGVVHQDRRRGEAASC